MICGMLFTGAAVMAAEDGVLAMNDQGQVAAYGTLEEAVADPNATWFRLNADLDGQTIPKSILLDLNGHSLTNVYIPAGVTLTGIDSATDDYEGDFGTVSGTVEGSIATTAKTTGEVKSYVTVCENGSYSFHRYYASIAAISLQPSQAGLGYRAEFRGDETLKNTVVNYGYALWVNDGAQKTYTRTDALEKSSLSLRLKNILSQGNDALNAIGATATIGGNAFVTLELGGEQITLSGTEQKITLRQVIETINANVGSYGEAQLQSVRELCTTYAPWMLGWATENIFSGNPGEGNQGDLKVEIVVDVVAENNILSQDTTMTHGNISAVVPQGTALVDGTTQLVLTITEKASSDSDVAEGEGESLTPLDIHIQGISPENATPIVICLGAVLPKGLNIGNYSLYHVESQGSVQMSRVYALSELDAHNEFYYDPATGFVTVSMASFSEVALLIDDVPVWEGEVEAFKSGNGAEDDPWIIANADQLAYMSQMVSNSEEYADDYYKLISDVDFGGYSNTVDENDVPTNVFYPIGYWKLQDGTNAAGEPYYGFGNAFRGVFDGNGNTVANLCQRTWDMDGNYDNGYWDDAMGLFGACFDATIKNLTMDNFQSDGEFTVTGCVAAFAGGKMLFENIYLTNCNPRVYNTGNGGIVGMNYNSTNGTPDEITFRNITVDQTNKITALWGSYDVGCGGIMGRLRDNAAHGVAENNTVHFENCHVAAIIDVYNDVCANYQYYQYRYCGMMIGTVDYIDMADYGVSGLDKVISAEDCTVTYGNWNEYWYCELVANSLASYTHDHQFSRLEKIDSIADISDDNGVTWKKAGNFVIPAINEENAVCYHIVKNADGSLSQHLHEHAGLEGKDVNGDGVTDEKDLKEDRQHYYLPFGQLFTGYGWGSTPVREMEGITVEDSGTVKAQEKFVPQAVIGEIQSGTEYSVDKFFAATVENSKIDMSNLQVFVSPADEESTVSGSYSGNGTEWRNGKLTFKGTGNAKLVITDYFYCTPTVLQITVKCGHEEEFLTEVAEQAPTCKEIGYTAGTYCDRCKTYATGHEPIAPLTHSWVDDVCTRCNMIRVWTGMTYDANAGQAFELEHAKLLGTKATVTVVGTNGQVITLANATLENGKLTIPAASMANAYLPTGNVEIEVENEAGQGYLLADVQITWVIHSWPELAVMEKHLVAEGNAYIGSLALGADFSMDKAHVGNWLWRNSERETFNGTFDGRGHTISDFTTRSTLRGIFKNLGADGVVKNLRMTDVTVTTYAAAVVGYQCYGKLENIYVQGSITDDGIMIDDTPAYFGSSLLAGHIYSGATIQNVLVVADHIVNDAETESMGVPTAFGYLRETKEADVFKNCYAVGANHKTIRYFRNGVLVRESFSEPSNGSFGSMWRLWTNENAAALATRFGLTPLEKPTGHIELDTSYDMNASGADFVVVDPTLTGEVVSVTVQGTDLTLANATVEDGKLTIPAASFVQKTMPSGDLTLVVLTEDLECTITGHFVWVIKDWGNVTTGLAYMHNHLTKSGDSYYGHLALGADIALTESNNPGYFEMGYEPATFEGTFDGRDFDVSGFNVVSPARSLFYMIGESGTVKNLKMTGVTVSTYAAPVTYICKGTLENIYVQGSIAAEGIDADDPLDNFGCGLLAGQYYSTAKVSNCIVELTSIAADLRLGTAFGQLRSGVTESIFSNCYAIGTTGNTFIHKVGAEWLKADFAQDGTNASFETLEALKTSGNEAAIALAKLFGLIIE